MATLRWGILSVGKISTDFTGVLKALAEEGHKVQAVAARDPARAQAFARAHGVTTAHGSYEALFADKDVDVVYVGAIHPSHHACVLAALDAGKAVLCEKPLGMNLKQTQEMVDRARKHQLFLMEGYWSRFFPAYVELRRHLAAGTVGEVRDVYVEFGILAGEEPNRLNQPGLGGGSLLDLGCYCVQFIAMVFGTQWPARITASATKHATGVDRAVQVLLEYPGGQLARFCCRSDCELPNRAVVSGTRGRLQIPERMWCPTKLTTPDGQTETFPLPDLRFETQYHNSHGFAYEARAVKESIDKGEKENVTVSHEQTLFIAKILNEVRNQLGVVYDADKE